MSGPDDLLRAPELLRKKKYADVLAIVGSYKGHDRHLEQLHRVIAMVVPHAGADAKKLYERVRASPFPLVHHLLAEYEPKHAAKFVELAPMGAAMVDKRYAKPGLDERARLDPGDHLAGLFDNADAMASLFMHFMSATARDPGPHRRAKPFSTDLRAFWGCDLPPALAAWVAVLDHWDLGHYELGKWQAWNPTPTYRAWNPLALPPANKNTIEWALALEGATQPWTDRAKDGTLNLLFANCAPIGRVEFTRAELGVFVGEPCEVLEIDREHDVRRIVAADFESFVGFAPRMKDWKPKPVKAKTRAIEMAARAGWIVDLLLGIPQIATVVKSYKQQADTGAMSFDLPGDALYWLFHCYFLDEKSALALVMTKAEASESKLVRDAAAFVKKDKLASKRGAFLSKIGKRSSKIVVPASGHAVDRKQLAAAAKQLAPTFKAMPAKPGSIDAAIKELPDTLEDHFEALTTDIGEGAREFALMLAIARDLTKTPTIVKGALETDDRESIAVYYGDLDVRGDLSFGCNTVVLGDLTVAGTIADAREFLYLWVTGNVKARFVHCRHKLWAGKLETKLALLGRRGTINVLKGMTSDLALRDDDEGNGFRGPMKAKHSIDLWAKDRDAQFAKLKSILLPKAFGELDPGLFDSENLVDLAERGKPYLR